MVVTLDRTTGLIVVDVQNDFCPGGALPVPAGDQVVAVLNAYIQRCQAVGAPIYATRDWHPARHCSFAPHGGPWPIHCVQGTQGAAWHADLRLPSDAVIISKASDPGEDAYSGFQGTTLAAELRARGIRRLLIGGLATDYCVKSTVLDALQEGFAVYCLADASRGVEGQPGDSARAIGEMTAAGTTMITLSDVA